MYELDAWSWSMQWTSDAIFQPDMARGGRDVGNNEPRPSLGLPGLQDRIGNPPEWQIPPVPVSPRDGG